MTVRNHLDRILERIDGKTGMGLSSVLGSPARYMVPYSMLERLAQGGDQTLIFQAGPQSIASRMIEFVAVKEGKSYGILVSPQSHTSFSESQVNPVQFGVEAPSAARQQGIDAIAQAAGFKDAEDFILQYYAKPNEVAPPIRPLRVSNFDIERGHTASHNSIVTQSGETFPLSLDGEMVFNVHTYQAKGKIHEIVSDNGHSGAGSKLTSVPRN